jgi:hypothetical protein
MNPKLMIGFLAGVLVVWITGTFVFGPPLHGAPLYLAWAATIAVLITLGAWIFKSVKRKP